MPYVPPELETDSVAQAAGILEAMPDLIPGWEPAEGSYETNVAEAYGIMAATVAQFIVDNASDAYAAFGERVLGLERVAAAAAAAPSTWTAKDNVGYLIPAGSSAVLTSPLTGQPVEFQTVAPANIVPGATTVTGVEMQAAETGPEPNGAIGTADQFESLPFITAVELTAAAAGGEDEETADAYISRLAGRQRRVRAIPISPGDHAAFALDVPGIERAAALNLLDPGPHPTPTGPTPYALLDELGHLTVFAIDVEGNPIDSITKAAATAYLSGDERALGLHVHMADATLTDLAVVASIRLAAGADPAAAIASAGGAVERYFDRSGWRYSADEPGLWSIPRTVVDRSVRAFDVAAAIESDSAVGAQSTVTCTINGAASVELAGWAPLPNLTSVTITIAS